MQVQFLPYQDILYVDTVQSPNGGMEARRRVTTAIVGGLIERGFTFDKPRFRSGVFSLRGTTYRYGIYDLGEELNQFTDALDYHTGEVVG